MPPGAASRYLLAQEIHEGDEQYLAPPAPFAFRELSDSAFHRVSQGDTWESLAGRYYAGMERACGYWWAIADFQPTGIVDPSIKLEPNTIVVIPSMRTLTTIILGERRRRDYAA